MGLFCQDVPTYVVHTTFEIKAARLKQRCPRAPVTAGAGALGLGQAMVPPCHSAPLHRAHHLILPQCDPAGPEGAREGRQTGGAR